MLEAINKRLDRIDSSNFTKQLFDMDKMNEMFDKMNDRFDKVDDRFDKIDQNIERLRKEFKMEIAKAIQMGRQNVDARGCNAINVDPPLEEVVYSLP